MRPGALWFMYRNRLRAQFGEEALAVFGIAVGVALVFAVLVANQSISGSVRDLIGGVVGRASLELHARDARGFDQNVYDRAVRTSAVRLAAPALVRRVAILGPDGRRTVTLFGGDRRLQRLGGTLIQRVGPVEVPALSLPAAVARPLGVHPGQRVTLVSGERRVTARVGALLSSEDIGGLARSPIAIAPLSYAQRLTGLRRRITHILVEPRPGAAVDARRALERLAGGKLDVRRSDSETALMREAAKSNDQSSLLFSAISAGIGLLFAYNAMLLTLPARRRLCAEMRLMGFRRGQVLASLLFETALLAMVGVGLGLVLGDLMSRVLFGEVPRYLAGAFAIGSQRIVTPATVVVACAVGLVATFAAAARPLRELYSVEPMDATHRLTLTHGERVGGGRSHLFFWAGLGLLATVTAIAFVVPSASLVAATVCALVSVAVLPLLLGWLVRLANALTRQGHRRAMGWIVVTEIAATPTRAVALAATAAVAVFGITTVEGARGDLIRGADVFADELGSAGAVHVVAGGQENYLGLEPFDARRALSRIRRVAAVRSVAVHRGELLDVGHRRLAVFGRPAGSRQLVMASSLTEGSLHAVSDRLRGGGWAATSSGFARERGLSLGERFLLPTPAGEKSFRVAGITTNYFWPPGAVVLGARDYGRLWGEGSASELMVEIRPGVAPQRARDEIAAALGPRSGLRVLTADGRAGEFGGTARQALSTLGQIGALVLICAVLAVAAAMGVAVWQRRRRLATLKTIGFRRGQLLRLIVVEAVILLTVGGAVGAGLGLYAQAVASRWVELTSGSSVSYSPALDLAAATVVVLVVLATVAAAVPGRLAAGVSPRAAFSE
jgi:putative ABC transport system permease protein